VVLIVFVSCLTLSFCSSDDVTDLALENGGCSAELSRQARTIIQMAASIAKAHNYEFPKNCLFQPELDLLKPFVQHTDFIRKGKWSCNYCGKVFTSQLHLDNHMYLKHGDSLEPEKICLGEYCDMLQCPSYIDMRARTPCDPKLMDKRKFICENWMQVCFPPHQSDTTSKLHDIFWKEFCGPLRCDVIPEIRYHEDPYYFSEKYGGKWTTKSAVWLAFTIILILIMFFCYIGLCLYKTERSTKADLQKLSWRKKLHLNFFKQKGY
jgi:hypothetical protein